MAPEIDEKNMIFALKYAFFPACFSSSRNFRGKYVNPKRRVQGWCASRVRWCTGSGCLSFSIDGCGFSQPGSNGGDDNVTLPLFSR